MVNLVHALGHIFTRLASGAVIAGLLCVAAQAQERFSELRLDQLTAEQQKMATILKTPPRNSELNGGPFNAYARSPSLGLLLLQVSDYVRFNSSLPPRLSEFAIMIAARQWSQPYEWRAHYPLAIKGGLDRQILVDLGAGARPQGMKEDEAALYDFCTELYRDKNVTDAAFKAALAKFGERGIMDLIGIIGYYDIASMALIVQKTTAKPVDEAPLLPLTR
ncbi:MAG TPA: carboxymuconolactone decarboxylase [Xanthobacteraceae bacterium]|nr:carboxymuconolactone decarboxylase [Xanthobacteraceae bacterium]